MLLPKPFRLLVPLLGGLIALAACGGQPGASVPTTAAPAAPTQAQPTEQPSSAPAPTLAPTTASTSQPAPTAAPQPSATSVPSSQAPAGTPALARGALTKRPIIVMIDNHPDA